MACRSTSKGTKAVEEIKAENPSASVSTIEMDVDNRESIQQASESVMQQFGRIDVLLNNAGIFNSHEETEKQLVDSFRTNIIGPALVTEAFTPLLAKAAKPYVLHVHSTLGCMTPISEKWEGIRFLPVQQLPCLGYRTSKAALNMLTIQQSEMLGPRGIKVFSVSPGLVVSNLRGATEELRTARGNAGDPKAAGQFFLSVIDGERDADVGKCIHKDGIWPW